MYVHVQYRHLRERYPGFPKLAWQLAWYVTESKAILTTTMHLGPEFRPKCQHQHVVCTCVFACIERSSWLDHGRDHGDGVTLIIIVEKSFTMTLHAQIWPVLRDYIHVHDFESSLARSKGFFRESSYAITDLEYWRKLSIHHIHLVFTFTGG
jgi:hypothetical protein